MKKILVVDDEHSINKIISYNLNISGYEVFSAFNGAEALEIFAQNKPDLILLDIMMPVMDGNTFCIELLKRYPAHNIPIIIMTAKHDSEQVLQSFAHGAVDYITKPFTIDIVLNQIKKYFDSGGEPDFSEYQFLY